MAKAKVTKKIIKGETPKNIEKKIPIELLENLTNYLKINDVQFQADCPKCGGYINVPYSSPVCPICKESLV